MGNSSNRHNPLAPDPGGQAEGSVANPQGVTTPDTMASDLDKNAKTRQDTAQPQTCCPNCGTVFEVSSEHLASSDTRVRCGECLSIFDALINLRSDNPLDEDEDFHIDEDGNILSADGTYTSAMAESGEAGVVSDESLANTEQGPDTSKEPAADQVDASTLDVTYSDYDLFSGEAGLPDVAYFDQTQDLDSLRFEEPDGDETFSDTLFVHDMTLADSPDHDDNSPALEPSALDTKVDFVTDDVQQEPVVFTYRDPDVSRNDHAAFGHAGNPDDTTPSFETEFPSSNKHQSSNTWITRALLAAFIIVLTTGLYGYRSRDALLQNPDVRPWLVKACTLIGCELDPLVNLEALKVLKRAVFSHPTIDNALVIDLAFVNQATFDQPYPVLEIRLTNSNGGLVVQNNVAPADYLDDWQTEDMLTAGERLDLSLTVEDPGQTASSFELKFRQ